MDLGTNESVKPVIYCRPERTTPKRGSPSSALSGFRWTLGPVTPEATALSRGQSVVCGVASRRSASLLAHCCAIALATSSSMPDSTARAEARSTLHQSSARRVGALTRGARESSLPRALVPRSGCQATYPSRLLTANPAALLRWTMRCTGAGGIVGPTSGRIPHTHMNPRAGCPSGGLHKFPCVVSDNRRIPKTIDVSPEGPLVDCFRAPRRFSRRFPRPEGLGAMLIYEVP